jgi:hypothetical protein
LEDIRRTSKATFAVALARLGTLLQSARTMKELKDGVTTAVKSLEGYAKAEGEADKTVRIEVEQVVKYDMRILLGLALDAHTDALEEGLITREAKDRLRDNLLARFQGAEGILALTMADIDGAGDSQGAGK